MSNSNLVNVRIPAHSNNYTVGRSGRRIEYIAIHHMAGIRNSRTMWFNISKWEEKGIK